jgi:outer membrane receptor protein involved in Fe transport
MSRNTKPAVAALLMLSQLMGGCGAQPNDKGTGTAAQSQSPQAPPPFGGEADVITGASTPHKQKDSPVETERISGKQLEQAGATHTGQVLQDVPAIQRGR